MNALANHAYLPRDGRNISQQDLITKFEEALNFAPGVLDDVAAGVVSTGTRGDGTFDLADSAKHGVVEHDASLSRADTFFGDANVFNPIIWAAVRKNFPNPTISIDEAARARASRINDGRAGNPQFNLSDAAVMGTFGENSLYLLLFGDSRVDGNANTLFVRTVFGEQDGELPSSVGKKDGVRKTKTNVGNRAGPAALPRGFCETDGADHR